MRIIISLSLIFLIITACSSKKSAEELMSEANSLKEEQKIPEAISNFEELVTNYPDNESAPKALLELASIYQNKLLKTLSEKESLKKSAEFFRRIYDEYTDSELAPTGLFMAGFIEANELQDYDKATATYKLFLEKFPESELSTSAKEELDNMGLTPEQILQKNLAKED